jgi:hypothetical protein
MMILYWEELRTNSKLFSQLCALRMVDVEGNQIWNATIMVSRYLNKDFKNFRSEGQFGLL